MIARRSPWLIAVACLGAAVAFSEMALRDAEKAALDSHQARWDCLTVESSKISSCREMAKLGPEDADYCDAAVKACKADGAYEQVALAEERYSNWHGRARWFRLALFVVAAASVAWLGLIRPLMRAR